VTEDQNVEKFGEALPVNIGQKRKRRLKKSRLKQVKKSLLKESDILTNHLVFWMPSVRCSRPFSERGYHKKNLFDPDLLPSGMRPARIVMVPCHRP
jgi:hypothetical protein